ncbi:MAG: ATP-binding protein, partial [bacterium]
GKTLATDTYIDSRDISGKMSEIFQQTINFISSNIRQIQGEQIVNSIGKPEISRIVLEELVTNALVHRDYFISAPIRVFVFFDRVEIISPGHLPNNLTVANIKAGNSTTRNPVLASFAYQVLPYRGFGSGILRALKNHPHIDFIDDRDGNLFKCIIWR